MESKNQYDIYEIRDFNNYEKGKFEKMYNEIKNLKNPKIIDIAGGEGQFYDLLKSYKSDLDYTLTDFSDKQLNLAKKKGVKTKKLDLSKKFDIVSNKFDVVIASEIIEHIFDTNFFISECKRILKKGGILILTTPNIASLGNRITMLFGRRPGCIDCRVENSSGHIRAFVKSDLEKMFKENKLKITKSVGQRVNLPILNRKKKFFKLNYFLGDIFPTLSNGFIIVTKK